VLAGIAPLLFRELEHAHIIIFILRGNNCLGLGDSSRWEMHLKVDAKRKGTFLQY